jgi:hypothetical protein
MFHLAQGLARGVHDPLSKGRRRQAMHKLAVEGRTCQISPKRPADGEGCRPTKMADGCSPGPLSSFLLAEEGWTLLFGRNAGAGSMNPRATSY